MNNELLQTRRLRTARELLALDEVRTLDADKDPVIIQQRREVEDLEDRVPRLLERDHMPKQVATEMLLNSTKLSGTMRRSCHRARENHYVSVQTREAGIYKIARRFSRSSLQQLAKWLRRAIALKGATQRESKQLLKNKTLSENKKEFLVKLLDARFEACNQTIDTLQFELKSRHEQKI